MASPYTPSRQERVLYRGYVGVTLFEAMVMLDTMGRHCHVNQCHSRKASSYAEALPPTEVVPRRG